MNRVVNKGGTQGFFKNAKGFKGFFEQVHAENTDKADPRIVRNPIDKRAEYVTLCKENTELARKLKQVDELLEQICFMGDDHGKDNWGNRALRCRLVLGMD